MNKQLEFDFNSNKESPLGIGSTIRGRILIGARLSQDFHYGRWPYCCPPKSEYFNQEYKYETIQPDAIFKMVWDGKWWDCRRYGYGIINDEDTIAYGNGSIAVYDFNGVEEL